MSVYDKIFPPRVLTLPNGKQVSKPRSRAPLAAVILVAMTALSVEVTGFDMEVLVSRIKEFFVILGDMIPPEWDYMPQIWQPLFDTIKMSLLGSFIGSILVVPFAMLASTNIIPPEHHPHPAHSGVRPDCHLYLRPGHFGGHHGHRHLHLRLHRKDPL